MSDSAAEAPRAEHVVEQLARRLDMAWSTGVPVPPLTESGLLDVRDAYAVQEAWTRLRVARGDRVVGRKIGLTSAAMQRLAGIDEPDYGALWRGSHYPAPGSHAVLPATDFIQPRIEGELAFLLGADLGGGRVTSRDVLLATAAVAPAIEVIDSRIEGWRIGLPDTIADNASFGGFVLGPWSTRPLYRDLRTLGMALSLNGELRETGAGAAALGGPARAVAWLANKLHGFGTSLERGAVVLSGALGTATDVELGDVITLELAGHPPLTVAFN